MDCLQTRSERRVPVVETGLPRQVLKHLFVAHRISIGGRFLDVGCGDSELMTFAQQLGLDADGLVCRAAQALNRSEPRHPDVHYVESCQHGVPIAEHSVDLILVRDLGLYRGALNQSPALDVTAQLLACVRPGGHLVLLLPHGVDAADRHRDACFVRHLVAFPGSVGMEILRESRWPWLRGSKSAEDSQFTITTLATPREPVSRAMWRKAARRAIAADHKDCCDRAVGLVPCQSPAEAA
ncbi:MAG: class I SAM-dependent methyltransferase [Planctomycetaceae bacterium]